MTSDAGMTDIPPPVLALILDRALDGDRPVRSWLQLALVCRCERLDTGKAALRPYAAQRHSVHTHLLVSRRRWQDVMHDIPVNVEFYPPCTDAQLAWLRHPRMPVTAVAFRPSRVPRKKPNLLKKLLVRDPTAFAASEATLQSLEGLDAQAVTPEQFAVFCGRFTALRRLDLLLPTEHGELALQNLPAGLHHLSCSGHLNSFSVRATAKARVCPTVPCTET